jgi:uncharacterized membrane protein YqhA
METLIRRARYVAVVGVLALLLASIAGFGWAGLKAFFAIESIVTSLGKDAYITTALVEVVDSVLIASVLFVAAASIYEIFIAQLSIPRSMTASSLYQLKSKVGSIVILAMALKFLEHLAEWKNPIDTLLFAIGIAVVSLALIALNYSTKKEEKED